MLFIGVDVGVGDWQLVIEGERLLMLVIVSESELDEKSCAKLPFLIAVIAVGAW